jgi:hypothetical protein
MYVYYVISLIRDIKKSVEFLIGNEAAKCKDPVELDLLH